MKRIALLLALATGACVSRATPSATVPADAFSRGDRVEDARHPGRFGTVTEAPDHGHHWLQSPLVVEWDDGDDDEWGYDEQVPVLHVVPTLTTP